MKLDSDRLALLLEPMLEQWDVQIPVAGNSMRPLWRHARDSALLRSCDVYSLKKGDIALYRRATGQVVLHRIVRVNADSYHMCGDAQSVLERHVPKAHVLAVVAAFTRKGRDYRCDQLPHRAYAALWIWLFPIRALIGKGQRLWSRRLS